MKYLILILMLFLTGCPKNPKATLYDPTPKDIEGQWETLSIFQLAPYALLDFDSKGNGVLILVMEEDTMVIDSINGFKSNKDGFTINIALTEDKPETVNASINYGQLCFVFGEEDDKEEEKAHKAVCFTKANRIPDYRKRALDKLKESKHRK